MGYVGWIDSFEGDKLSKLKYLAESELVRELESLGAIVTAKVRPNQYDNVCSSIHVTDTFQSTLVQSLWVRESCPHTFLQV